MDATRRVWSGVRILLAGTLGVVVAVPLAVLLATAFYLRVVVFGGLALGRALRRACPGGDKPRRLPLI